LRNRRGSGEIGARDSAIVGGAFAGFDVHRAAERRAGQARAAKRIRSNSPPLIVENLVTNTFPSR